MGDRQRSLDAVEGDMTPMIDVVFQLIIFFMTTIRFKALEGKFDTQLPKGVGHDVARSDVNLLAAEIGLHPDPARRDGYAVTLNGTSMPGLPTLRARLAELKRHSPELKATLRPEAGISYAQVVQVVDECVKAQLFDISFSGIAFDA